MPNEAVADVAFPAARLDLETVFHAQYPRIARLIVGIIKDPARAEELAVEVFLKWEQTPRAQHEGAEGWLYRTAVRMALNELRRAARRNRYENLFAFAAFAKPAAPAADETLAAIQEEQKIRRVLGVIPKRDAALLLLRGNGLTYEELASTLNLNPASIGTLLSRALRTCRKEFIQRYGEQGHGK